ncbi:response regulator [Ornithinibacillus bavariensis]|nr:response regulator [Ornithinibacillus bavariensis]
MMRVLIVDDEHVEREGMRAILSRSFPSLSIIEARNGKMAIDVARERKPDLILMDIKMPGMSGLEAMEQIREDNPDTKFIMVTAYDTFEYMRQAIKLGATDYLLKPSKINDIIDIVGKVLKQIMLEQKSRISTKRQQHIFQKTMSVIETDVVTQLLFDHVHEVHLDMLVEILGIETKAEMFVINIHLPAGSEDNYSKIKEVVRQTGYSLVGALHSNQLPIIVFRTNGISYRSQATSLAREILSVRENPNEEGWFIGIGKVYPSLDDVRKSYQEALISCLDITTPVKYKFYPDIPGDNYESNDQVKLLQKELPDLIRFGQWEQVQVKIINVIRLFENNGINPLQAQQRILEVLWTVSKVLNELGIDSDTPLYSYRTLDYRQLRSETVSLLGQMKQLHTEYYQRLEADNVEQIKRYIIEHSHEDISLEALGKRMGLSPIYISKIFKEKIGVNYIDFLTECRIERAKKLMADPNRSIKEIAIEVGYHEPNYFSKVFKKMVRISPSDYQKTVLGKKD